MAAWNGGLVGRGLQGARVAARQSPGWVHSSSNSVPATNCINIHRHGDFFTAVLKARPEFINDWQAKLWSRFFCLSVYITMYLNDHQRSAFYESLGLNTVSCCALAGLGGCGWVVYSWEVDGKVPGKRSGKRGCMCGDLDLDIQDPRSGCCSRACLPPHLLRPADPVQPARDH